MIMVQPQAPGGVTLRMKPTMGLELAQVVASGAFREAKTNGWNVTIAIVDDGANLCYLAKMDGCQLGSVTVAQEKAAGALKFKRPTRAMQDLVKDNNVHMMSLPGLVPVEGGVPIIVQDHVVGAIGISGVTSAQDGQIAAAGLAELARMQINIA